MSGLNNINISEKYKLTSPGELYREIPLTEASGKTVAEGRKEIENFLNHKSTRKLIVIAGPCSIHNETDAFEYASRLAALKKKVDDKIFLAMRVYFEKPRTTVGWKGLIYDPDLNRSYDFEKGLRMARRIMLQVNETGIPVATEILDPIITQYIADMVSWAAIGARTTESQTHRQMVSGLSMPVGFKNATNGNIDVAVDAIQAASAPHAFIGVMPDGQTGIFRTKGNRYCHVILRGGKNSPNYYPQYIAFTTELLRQHGLAQNIIVDCSHDNSLKNFKNQGSVFRNIIRQKQEGNESVIGVMLESHLREGAQKLTAGVRPEPGLSITDSCIGWNETEELILEACERLS